MWQDPNHFSVTGIDKQKVGQYAAEIRAKKPPEPYKGKGLSLIHIFLKPVITENSMAGIADKKYTFKVATDATKVEIDVYKRQE